MIKLDAILKMLRFKIKSRKFKVTFFGFKNSHGLHQSYKGLVSLTSFNEYIDFISFFDIEPQWNSNKRFSDGAIFFAIHDQSAIISYGWGMKDNLFFPVEEIDVLITVPTNSLVLYDFFTYEKYRNKGYYKRLLYYILSSQMYDRFLIYALHNNISSIKAINKSGFANFGTFSHWTIKKSKELKEYKPKKIPFFVNTRRYL